MGGVDFSRVTWHRSSRTGGANGGGGNCVEVAYAADVVAIRDSKDPSGPALVFSSGGFASLLDTVRSGGLDLD